MSAQILIADDDPSIRGLLKLVERAGYTVDLARDGAEALQKIEKRAAGRGERHPGAGRRAHAADATRESPPSVRDARRGADLVALLPRRPLSCDYLQFGQV